jgi:hypothetical protein
VSVVWSKKVRAGAQIPEGGVVGFLVGDILLVFGLVSVVSELLRLWESRALMVGLVGC